TADNSVTEYPVQWVDRKGAVASLITEPGTYANPRLSPDGRRLALTVFKNGNWDIWVYDLERGVPTRLTFDDAAETEQVWSPDGRALIFSSDESGLDQLFRKRADGSGETQPLTTPQLAKAALWASSWSHDGHIAFTASNPGTGFDVFVASIANPDKADAFVS